MRIATLLIPIFVSIKAIAAGPSCSSFFEVNSPIIQAKIEELSKVLAILNLDARLLLEEYHFRPQIRKAKRSRSWDFRDYQVELFENLANATRTLREAVAQKNALQKEIPKDNEEFQRLTILDKNMDFQAKYLGRINALDVLIRSHLGLMDIDIIRSSNMTKSGEYSSSPTPALQIEKMKTLEVLREMLRALNKLNHLEQAEDFQLGKNEKSTLLTTLKIDGDALIRRLMFRFKVDEAVVETLLNEWIKVHARQSRDIYAPYIYRVDGYSYWPL